MKILFAVSLLALVACSYAAPTSDLSQTLLNQLDNAQLMSLLDVQAQDDGPAADNGALLMAMMEGDDEYKIAALQAIMQDARAQKWFTSAFNKIKSFGSKVYKGVKKVASNPIAKRLLKYAINKVSPIPLPLPFNHKITKSQNDDVIAELKALMQEDGDSPGEAEVENDESDGIAELEAMLKDAQFQGWASKFKKGLDLAKKVASNPMVRKLGQDGLKYYMAGHGEAKAETDDRDNALLMAMMQDDESDGIAELEAMLQDAQFQGWVSKLKTFGTNAFNIAKKVASNPTLRKIGQDALKYYTGGIREAKAETDDSEIARLMAMMQDENDKEDDTKISELVDALLLDA